MSLIDIHVSVCLPSRLKSKTNCQSETQDGVDLLGQPINVKYFFKKFYSVPTLSQGIHEMDQFSSWQKKILTVGGQTCCHNGVGLSANLFPGS